MDRRRLLEAHFKFAILNVAFWYQDTFSSPVVFFSDIHRTLTDVTPLFQKAFHTQYSGRLLKLPQYCKVPLLQHIVAKKKDVAKYWLLMET